MKGGWEGEGKKGGRGREEKGMIFALNIHVHVHDVSTCV